MKPFMALLPPPHQVAFPLQPAPTLQPSTFYIFFLTLSTIPQSYLLQPSSIFSNTVPSSTTLCNQPFPTLHSPLACERWHPVTSIRLHASLYNPQPSPTFNARYQMKDANLSIQWNKTDARVLAPSPSAAAPLAETTGMEARSGYVSTGCQEYTPGLVSSRAAYYTRERGWYKAFRGTTLEKAWYGPYMFSDGVTLGLTATRRLYNASRDFIGVCGADLTLVFVGVGVEKWWCKCMDFLLPSDPIQSI